MTPYLEAIVLGIIEGATEFLPVSSTGHLLIAQHWLAQRSELFNIAVQSGAILAISLVYRERLLALALGLRDKPNRDYAFKIAAAFGVTAVLGLVVKALGWKLPETVTPVAWALIVGGVFILIAERLAKRSAQRLGERSEITWTVAALVGVAQVIAGVFPGTSRSAAAIFAALLFGVTRRAAATEFAFLVGIPTMFAATGYALVDTLHHRGIGGEAWGQLAVAFVTAAVTGFFTVKWLLRYVQSHSFAPFAYYRFALGAALLWLLPSGS